MSPLGKLNRWNEENVRHLRAQWPIGAAKRPVDKFDLVPKRAKSGNRKSVDEDSKNDCNESLAYSIQRRPSEREKAPLERTKSTWMTRQVVGHTKGLTRKSFASFCYCHIWFDIFSVLCGGGSQPPVGFRLPLISDTDRHIETATDAL